MICQISLLLFFSFCLLFCVNFPYSEERFPPIRVYLITRYVLFLREMKSKMLPETSSNGYRHDHVTNDVVRISPQALLTSWNEAKKILQHQAHGRRYKREGEMGDLRAREARAPPSLSTRFANKCSFPLHFRDQMLPSPSPFAAQMLPFPPLSRPNPHFPSPF